MSNHPESTRDDDTEYDDLEPTMEEVRATGLGFATEDMGPPDGIGDETES